METVANGWVTQTCPEWIINFPIWIWQIANEEIFALFLFQNPQTCTIPTMVSNKKYAKFRNPCPPAMSPRRNTKSQMTKSTIGSSWIWFPIPAEMTRSLNRLVFFSIIYPYSETSPADLPWDQYHVNIFIILFVINQKKTQFSALERNECQNDTTV